MASPSSPNVELRDLDRDLEQGIITPQSIISGEDRVTTPLPPGTLAPPQEVFIKAVIGILPESGSLIAACAWYTVFLQCKIREAWLQLFRPVLVNVDEASTTPSNGDIETAFRFFTVVVSMFGRKNLALVEIVDEAYDKGLFTRGDEERSIAHQLAFAAVGWISTLYSPNLVPDKELLRILNTNDGDRAMDPDTPNRRSTRYKSKTFSTYNQPLDKKDEALYTLLQRFGKIIPDYNAGSLSPQNARETIPGRNDGWIDPLLICFHTLNKCTSITIEWVDSLSLHLEFDSRTKILKLFRFPSFCFLMSCKDKKYPSLVSQIFENSTAFSDSYAADTDESSEFFKEVLLSYRLIFGQTKNSYRDFNKLARKWRREWNKTAESQKEADPMLYILCGEPCTSPNSRDIYDEIEAEDPTTHYSPVADYPFFGERLIELQSYVRGHNFMALWYDRRDVSWWWTFWAVIIIGGLTIAFGLLQSVLQIIQVVYARQEAGRKSDLR